ncbi:MAG: Na(+)/H(+) antiporter subunit D [Proteobacteria bacterium]|nr:Na(+)/H(+) antiporter subunit D [Pseudomonadota bacterium]
MATEGLQAAELLADLPLGLPLTAPFGATWDLPPAFIFFAGALLVAVLKPGGLRTLVLFAAPALGALNILFLGTDSSWTVDLLEFDLEFLRVDRLSLLFGYIFHVAAFLGVIYGLHVKDRMQQFAALAYPGAALGAVFAGDLITLFIFWEILALTSVLLIWARRSDRSPGAGMRYLLVNVISGLLLLGGAIALYSRTGSTEFGYIGLDGFGAWLILLSFGIKAAFPLLHNWLTDAYPEATPWGTVLLSGFTTKVAVYALARGFPGTELLVYVGAVMTFFPIYFAVIENDLRRVLAYSMINQIGFMVIGVGIGTSLALNGAVSHAFNDVLFKGLLMMTMGVVLHMTGEIKGSNLGGLYKTLPKTTILCIVGAASISAFPLFSGFVSKSMVILAAIEEGYTVIWLVMLFASAGVFHHAGIKIPYFAFFSHDSGIRVRESDVPKGMMVAMALAAGLCLFIGIYPSFLYGLLPWEVAFEPYTKTHVLIQTQLLFFSAIAFAWLMLERLYPPELHSTNLDAEWLYRRAGPRLLGAFGRGIAWVDAALRASALKHLAAAIRGVTALSGPDGVLARTLPIGRTTIWVLVMLFGFLIFNLF